MHDHKNTKRCGATCWHDMRPSVQLPSVSGVDSEFDIIQAVITPDTQHAVLWRFFLTSAASTFHRLNWKMASFHLRWRTFTPSLIVLSLLCFQV